MMKNRKEFKDLTWDMDTIEEQCAEIARLRDLNKELEQIVRDLSIAVEAYDWEANHGGRAR